VADIDPLQCALDVEAFIASCRLDGPNGALWSRTPDTTSTPRTMYHGSAGIAIFYLELSRTTGDRRHLAEAISAGDELLAHLDSQDRVTIGFYSGWPGYIFALNEIGLASGAQRFRTGAERATERMAEQSQPLGAGIGWIEPMPFSDITGITGDREVLDLSIGAAGAGLGFLYAHRHGLDERALDWARQTADRLLEMAIDTAAGPNWLMMADMPFPFTAPNFAHGAAGVGYFLAELHRATNDARYLHAAIAAAGYVAAHTTASGDGHLVCHTEENPQLMYLGVCHGPPGTGRLMYVLHEITGDASWLDWLHGNMRGLLATGAPEVRSRGLWENYGQCCGDAGIGDYALSLYRSTGRREYLELAQRIAATLIERSRFDDGRRSWMQAEHRSRPEFLEEQTGYMQGAAGLGSFLLHLATIDETITSKLVLADSPFAD
jgi:lantibiotic modifying enzyme